MGKRLLKVISVILIVCIGLFAFAGCQDKGIEGTWILTEEYDSDGTKITSEKLKEIGVAEKYEISGTEVKYTCETKLLKKTGHDHFRARGSRKQLLQFQNVIRIRFRDGSGEGEHDDLHRRYGEKRDQNGLQETKTVIGPACSRKPENQ